MWAERCGLWLFVFEGNDSNPFGNYHEQITNRTVLHLDRTLPASFFCILLQQFQGKLLLIDGICHMFLAFVTFVLICMAPFPAQGFSKPQDTLPVGAMKDLMTPATINCMGQHGCLLGSPSHFSVI